MKDKQQGLICRDKWVYVFKSSDVFGSNLTDTQRTWMVIKTQKGHAEEMAHFYGGLILHNYFGSIITDWKKEKNVMNWSSMADMVLEKTGTYFQIMDDFLNFFKTSLFWSPIRGCSLKQRLTEKKHSCSNTIDSSCRAKKSPTKMSQRYTWKIQTIKATQQSELATDSEGFARPLSVLTSRSCRVHSSNRCCSSHAGYRTSAMISDRAPESQKVFHSLFTLGRLLATINHMQTHGGWIHLFCERRGEMCVSYIAVILTRVIRTAASVQRPEVLQHNKHVYIFYFTGIPRKAN